MSKENQESFLSNITKNVIIAVVTVVITAVATHLMERTRFSQKVQEAKVTVAQETKAQFSQDSMQAFNRSQQKIQEQMEKYEQLLGKYEKLQEKYQKLLTGKQVVSEDTHRKVTREVAVVERPKQPSTNINGNWYTPDRTVVWSFSNGQLRIYGLGNYSGFVSGSGSYSIQNRRVTGRVRLDVVMWNPVNQSVSFEANLSYNNSAMTGNITDSFGMTNAMALYRE